MSFEQQKEYLLKATFSLWVNWAYPFVGIIALTLVAPHVSKHVFPIIIYLVSFAILVIIRKSRGRDSSNCHYIPYIVAVTLMWAATMFVLFNLLAVLKVKTAPNGQPYNPEIPWLPILVFAPIGMAVCRWFMRPRKSAYCRDCQARNGNSSERGYLAPLFTKEAEFQIQCMFYIWTGLGIAAWIYYFTAYKNVNLNHPDMYFYTYVPVSVYVLSLVYIGFRSHGYYIYYQTAEARDDKDVTGKTTVRFLVISGDTLWLRVPKITGFENPEDLPVIDTPVSFEMNYRSNFNAIEATNLFKERTSIKGAEVRYLYHTDGYHAISNIFHYAVFLDNAECVSSSVYDGEWLNFKKIQLLHQAHLLSNLLEAELHRIHTTVMAWKTYSRNGKRLYEIKNYQPTFRLSDMKKWDVNYDDPIWMFVSMNNEDKPFYRFRRIWRKLITGTGI